jgi:hypothetical protein
MSIYGAHEAKLYYVDEVTYGRIPTEPTMSGIELVEDVNPAINPGLIKLRGIGSRDLQAIIHGLKQVDLKVAYTMPHDNPIKFLNYIVTLNPFTAELIYEKPTGQIISLRHTGCISDKATVECSAEDIIKVSKDIIAQNLFAEPVKITGATYGADSGAIPFSESYIQKGSPDGTGLMTLDTVTDWKFSIENNLKRVPVIRKNQQSLLTGTASSGQKVVAVTNGALFTAGDMVKIQDDNASEWNTIYSIATNNLTMLNNLANTYTVAANGYVEGLIADLLKYLQGRHRALTGELTFTFEDRTEFLETTHDFEFSIKIGLSGTSNALLKYCKWDSAAAPTREEDLVSVKAPFTAREIILA